MLYIRSLLSEPELVIAESNLVLKLSLTPVSFYILSRISFLELRRLNSISRCFLGEKLKISLQLVAAERVKKLPRCELLNFKLPPPAL